MNSKFGLKKKVVSTLSSEQQQKVNGGGTTSFNVCSKGFICCGKGTAGSFTYCTPPLIPMPPTISQ
jgi:hypothetical protein